MADPPSQRLEAGVGRGLEDETVWKEVRRLDLPSGSTVASAKVSEDSVQCMSAEEIDEDDLLDEEDEPHSEFYDADLHSLEEIEEMKREFLGKSAQELDIDVAAEYRKEMEEDRIADTKNGHLVDDLEMKWSPPSSKNQKNRVAPSSSTRKLATASGSPTVGYGVREGG